VLLHQPRDAFEIEAELVARGNGAESRQIGRSVGGKDGCRLFKIVLEAGRANDLEQPRGGVTRVPEGVRHGAWLKDECSRTGY
jgi:hypothetical protein